MTNTQSHAQREFNAMRATTPDAVVLEFEKEILALCEKFGLSGQSGGSAPYVAKIISSVVEKLCLQKSIAPLTGSDEEWTDTGTVMDGDKPMLQNNRDGRVFKDGKDGRAYFIDAIVFDGDLGGTFTSGGSVEHDGKIIGSAHYIKSFPFEPKSFYVSVADQRWDDKEETRPNPEGDYWSHAVTELGEAEIAAAFQYYDQLTK